MGTYPQNANIIIRKRFIRPPAMSAVGTPAIIRCANVLANIKKIQSCKNIVMPRESTLSVHLAFL